MSWILSVIFVALTVLSPFQQTEFHGLTLSTPYPAEVVPPGNPVNLPIEIHSYGLPPEIVDLSIAKAPADWQVHFIGNSRVVSEVYLGPDASQSLTLKVEPPTDVTLGDYQIMLDAKSADGSAELAITLTVGEAFPPELKLEADLPQLKGSPTTTFSFRGNVTNESDQDMLVSFQGQVPPGFTITFKQGVGGQELTSLPVAAGKTESITIEVKPGPDATAGDYPIDAQVLSDQASADLHLIASITGQPDLAISTADGRLSGRVTSGKVTPMQITVTNNGSAPAQNVRLESTAPSGWNITFDPVAVPVIGPGQQVEVTVNYSPADKSVAGDYMVTLSAVPDGGSRASADFRITLLTSTLWGVVGLVLIAAALGVVALAVARFGRR
jgi:uncharacterized repeat protein (TIGR01451 family)